MKLNFNRDQVLNLVNISRNTEGHSSHYGEDLGKGLQLVGDHGIYLLSNALNQTKGADGKYPLCYANECNPDDMEFDDWWAAKNTIWGGDDGAEFISLEDLEKLIKACPDFKKLVINIKPTRFEISVTKR